MGFSTDDSRPYPGFYRPKGGAMSANPNGSRRERRLYERNFGKRRAPKPYVKAAHIWHDETGICQIHQRKCPRTA
jgi:hypothetical protein